MTTKNEQAQRMYDALKRITQYQTPDRMRRSAEKDWGVSYVEALEMAYENMQQEARNGIRGMRRPLVCPKVMP